MVFGYGNPGAGLGKSTAPFAASRLFKEINSADVDPDAVPEVNRPPGFLRTSRTAGAKVGICTISIGARGAISGSNSGSVPGPFAEELLAPVEVPITEDAKVVKVGVSRVVFIML